MRIIQKSKYPVRQGVAPDRAVRKPTRAVRHAVMITGTVKSLPNGAWSAKHGTLNIHKTTPLDLYKTTPLDRVAIVKSGVPAAYIQQLTSRMNISKEKFYRTAGLYRATVDRKVRHSQSLSPDESERVLGMARLVGQAESLVAESGNSTGFDAAVWFGEWMDRPLPALGGKPPAGFMDTSDGRALVSDLLAQQQSSAYA